MKSFQIHDRKISTGFVQVKKKNFQETAQNKNSYYKPEWAG